MGLGLPASVSFERLQAPFASLRGACRDPTAFSSRRPLPARVPSRTKTRWWINLLDRLALDKMLATDSSDRLHNQHPPPPAVSTKTGRLSGLHQRGGGQFSTPVPLVWGANLHAE